MFKNILLSRVHKYNKVRKNIYMPVKRNDTYEYREVDKRPDLSVINSK